MPVAIQVDFWEERYETGSTPWDLGGPSPHFVALLQEKPDWLKPGKMAVPGSGRGHDAALFAKAGFEVTGFDYSLAAVERAKDLYGKIANFEHADIFTLSDSPFAGQFDYVLEHTCFCAILPKQRMDYAVMANSLLKPKGLLLGVFWEHTDTDGPPFITTMKDVQTIFETTFEILSVEEKTAAAGRDGVERLIVMQRRA